MDGIHVYMPFRARQASVVRTDAWQATVPTTDARFRRLRASAQIEHIPRDYQLTN